MATIHLIESRVTSEQMAEMLEVYGGYVKLAVDIERGVVAGGGVLHADCEAVLLESGSRQDSIWGADWIPGSKEVQFEALINIRPKQGNRSTTIEDSAIRSRVEEVVRGRMGAS